MILCLDVGNSHIFGGVFDGGKIKLRFRHTSIPHNSSDQIGVFLRQVLRENDVKHSDISHIAICSVVPKIDYSLGSACIKYFNIEPFVLQSGVKTGVKIKCHNAPEIGADLIASAIAAVHKFPTKNIIVADLGTATTFVAIDKDKHFLGATIMPGMRLSMETLQNNTAKLSAVKIVKATSALGRNTTTAIQSGIYFSHLASLKMISALIAKELFNDEPPVIIGTGGFTHLFEKENIFHHVVPDLVLEGLHIALVQNMES
ncbi:MAG: pantothenate kinase [Thiotrichales bacterium]|nr:MAG: pantothenate kinase [Thiotrichales bacterium]